MADKEYLFEIKVVAGSAQNGISPFDENRVKVKVTKPAHKGQANKECLKFLAQRLGVKSSDIELVSGGACAWKTIKVKGCLRPPMKILLESKE